MSVDRLGRAGTGCAPLRRWALSAPGRLALSGAVDAGHVPGEHEASVGSGQRTSW